MQTAEVDGLVSQVVNGPNISDGAAAGAHENRVRDGLLAREPHARQQRAIADAGRTEQSALALDELVHAENVSQLGIRNLGPELSTFGIVSRPTSQEHAAAQRFKRGRR